MKTYIKAVLFDNDGVITDSMSDLYLSWKYVYKKLFGVNITRSQYFLLEGKNSVEIATIFAKQFGLGEVDNQMIIHQKDAYNYSHFTFRLFPRVIPTVKKIRKQGLKTALVTGGSLSRISKVTPKAVMDLFDAVVSAESVVHGKPSPDPYLKALELLNITNKEAVVVENATLGIASAKAAGLYCIVLPTSLPCAKLKGADVCIHDIAEVPSLLTRLEL